MDARYGDEASKLKIGKVLGEFLGRYLRNFNKRVLYNYLLRDVTIGSLELVAGAALMISAWCGSWHWWLARAGGQPTATSVIMLVVMLVLVGLLFMAYEIASVPRNALGRMPHQDISASRLEARRGNVSVPFPAGFSPACR